MSFPIFQIRKQWARVIENGWLIFFQEAAKRFNFTAQLLIAIASRETNLDPKWLTKAGDKGNGYGLMQIDRRFFPEWVKSGGWRDAREGILKGAMVLDNIRRSLVDRRGEEVTVKSISGTRRKFIMPTLLEPDLTCVAVAAYNCGDWAPYHYSKGRSCDWGTTGQDYSEDVLDRAQKFARFIDTDEDFNNSIPPAAPPAGKSQDEIDTAPLPEAPQVTEKTPQTSAEASQVTADELVSTTTAVPGLKECARGFAGTAFGGWKKISSWFTALGISFNAGALKPWVVCLALAALFTWFVVYTVRKRRKAKK